MKVFPKAVLLLIIVLSLVFMLVGVAGAVDLVFRQSDPPSEIEGLREAVKKWNAMNPDIQVRFETVPWSDALTQFIREGQAGGGPDVLQLAFVWTKDLASGELLANLDDFIEENPPGRGIDDFLGTDLGVYNGSIYGIPWTVDTFVIAYRPDLFEEAGTKAVLETWDELTWDEFFEVAKTLTRDTDGDGRTDQYGFGFPAGSASGGGMWFLVNYYLWSNDKFFVEQAEDGSWKIGVKPEDVVEVMNYFNRFFEEGVSPKSLIAVNNWGDPELVGGLARGDFAMSFFPPATFRAAKSQSDAPLATAMMPKGSVRRVSHLGGRSLAINANTPHLEESWEFLKYLLSRDVFELYPQFPAQESLLSELEFGEGEEGYAQQLPYAITFNQYIESPAPVNAMWDATNREFAAVYSGQKTPEQAARDLIATIEEFLERNQ